MGGGLPSAVLSVAMAGVVRRQEHGGPGCSWANVIYYSGKVNVKAPQRKVDTRDCKGNSWRHGGYSVTWARACI